MSTYLYDAFDCIYYHDKYTFQSESTLYTLFWMSRNSLLQTDTITSYILSVSSKEFIDIQATTIEW